MATKLHELLAVNSPLEAQATKCRTELIGTFNNKRHLFQAKIVTFKPTEDGQVEQTEAQSDIQSSVAQEVEWIRKIMGKAIDSGHQIDMANTIAKADVITEDGKTLLKDVPSTSLLQLEHRVKELHDLLNAIPTLDPAKGFTLDDTKPKGTYRAHEVSKNRTKKVFAPVIMVPATKEHAAQVEKLFEDRVVGHVVEQEWSSLITPAMKADLLDNCEKLGRAVKAARARANEQEVNVKENKIADTLLDYVFTPLE